VLPEASPDKMEILLNKTVFSHKKERPTEAPLFI
jgi:hypothetical protein